MFNIRWKQSALNELASLWMDASPEQRREITEAANMIDQILQVNPEEQGESRPNGRRIFFVPPLGVLFRVRQQQGFVRVLQVWRY